MTLNPELRRYMWLELSRHRMLAVPLLIAAFITLAMTTDRPAQYIFTGAVTVFIIMVTVIGSVRAYGSVTDEVRDRTWDFQRMSALQPWSLALGKIFGAPVFCWYVGLWTLAVGAVAAFASDYPYIISGMVITVAASIMLHALGVAASAATAQLGLSPRMRRGGAALGLIVLSYLGSAIGAIFFVMSDAKNSREIINWWFVDGLPLVTFGAFSSVAFAGWAVFAAWRCMAAELREPARWWAWAAFAAFVAFWYAGISSSGHRGITAGNAASVAAMILTAAAYFGLLLNPLTQVSRSRYSRANDAQPALAIERRVPVWLINGALALAVALLAVVLDILVGTPSASLAAATASSTKPIVPVGLAFVLPLAFMLLRDMAIFSCFSLNPTLKRPVAMALFYLAVANFLVPTLLNALGAPLLAQAVFPFAAPQAGWWPSVGFALHAVVAVAVLWFVVQRQRGEPL